MNPRLTFLIAAMFGAMVDLAAQTPDDSVLHAMNAVKLDSAYVYGEARDASLASAREQAFADLASKCSELSETLRLQPLDSAKVPTLWHRSGSRTHFLAYVVKDSLRVSTVTPEVAENGHVRAWLDQDIRSAHSWKDIEALLGKAPYSEICRAGVVDIATDEATLRRSYLVLVRGAAEKIVCICSPGEIMTGYRPGDTVRWILID